MNIDDSRSILCQECFKMKPSNEFISEGAIVCCDCESKAQKETVWTCFVCNKKISENKFYCESCLNGLDDNIISAKTAYECLKARYAKILKIEKSMKGK